MTKPRNKAPKTPRGGRLRQRAEALLKRSPRAVAATPVGEIQDLVHELRVHQAELEMQNEELRRVQLELEDSRDRFVRLYDFAPVGYLTLDAEGVIREANLTAARLLGLDRAGLLKKKLSRFVAAESQDDFYLHRQRVFSNAGLQTCDVQMRRADGAAFSGRLETVVETAGPGRPAQCLVALSDVTRLLRAEALSQSEANYRLLFELNPAPMWICDENTLAFLDVNEAALKLYGWSRNEFLRMTAKDIRPPADVPEFVRRVKQQRGSRAAFVGERQHVKRDGSVVDVAVTISSIPYAGRQARLVLVNDISERKRAEATLRESEQRFRLAVDFTYDWEYWIDPQGRFIYASPSCERITGYKPAEFLAKPGLMRWLVHPADRARYDQHNRESRQRGQHVEHEWRMRRRDGSYRWIGHTCQRVFNDRGEFMGVRGSNRDITERKQAEALLKQLNATLERRVTERTKELTDANQRLQAIMDSALVCILTLDERGRIEFANPAAVQIFGYTPKQMMGCNIGRLMASPTQTQHEDFLAHCLLRQDTEFMSISGEVLGRRKDGKGIMLELTLTRFAHGGRPLFLAMMRDITDRKRLERGLLEISERERRQVGHDLHDGLGQHLHGLAYLASLLEKDLQQGASPCTADAGQLSKYLKEALEMTRSLARGLQPVDAEPEGLMLALRELVKRARGVFRVDCQFECPSPVLIHRHSAANHLYRIAQEAVNNAMKHGKPTRIRIQLKATPARIILGVRDNGVGIRRRTKPGRGMGLHVMQYRADAVGGSLLVQRHPQEGTDVVCTVPRQALLPQEHDIK